MMRFRRVSVGLAMMMLSLGILSHGQDDGSRRGRKYKAPPATSRIEVVVTKNANGKPIANAAVIFRATKNGKDDGNLEIKTDPDGKASLDVITTGSKVLVQVIANGFATFAEEYQVDEASREIHVALLRPREQLSAYQDNYGKEAARQPGVQEPAAPHPPAPAGAPTLVPRAGAPAQGAAPGASTSDPSSSSGSQAGEPGTKSTQTAPAAQGSDTKSTPGQTQSAPQP